MVFVEMNACGQQFVMYVNMETPPVSNVRVTKDAIISL